MKDHRLLVITLFSLTLLSACGSSPRYNYYMLSAGANASGMGFTPSVGIGKVSVPEYLVRDNLVYHVDGNTLTVSDTDHWAEPLTDGIARVVALNLASTLNTQDIRVAPWHATRKPDYAVNIRVLGLESRADSASLVAEWVLYRPANDQALARRISRLHVDTDSAQPPSKSVAAAYSALLLELAELIAQEISSDDDSA